MFKTLFASNNFLYQRWLFNRKILSTYWTECMSYWLILSYTFMRKSLLWRDGVISYIHWWITLFFFRDLFIRNSGVKTLTSLVTGFTTFTSQDGIRFSTLIFFLSCCHYLTHKLYIKKLFKDSDPLNLGWAKKRKE